MLKTWSCCPCVEKAHLRCVEQVFTVSLGSKPSDPVGKEIGKRFLILTVSSHTILKDLRPLFSTGHYFVFLQNSSFIIVLSSHLEPAFWAHLPLVKHLSSNNSVITTNFTTSKFKMSLMKPWKNWYVFINLQDKIQYCTLGRGI